MQLNKIVSPTVSQIIRDILIIAKLSHLMSHATPLAPVESMSSARTTED
jgi:hypothetical protein